MNDIIAGSNSSSSVSTQNNASNDLLAPGTNLWASSTSQVQQACAAGNIAGCP
jgi:hypothetical protein